MYSFFVLFIKQMPTFSSLTTVFGNGEAQQHFSIQRKRKNTKQTGSIEVGLINTSNHCHGIPTRHTADSAFPRPSLSPC